MPWRSGELGGGREGQAEGVGCGRSFPAGAPQGQGQLSPPGAELPLTSFFLCCCDWEPGCWQGRVTPGMSSPFSQPQLPPSLNGELAFGLRGPFSGPVAFISMCHRPINEGTLQGRWKAVVAAGYLYSTRWALCS